MQIILDQIELVVESVTRRYLAFVQSAELALSAALHQSQLPGNPLPHQFESRLDALVYPHLFSIERQFAEGFDVIVRQALSELASGVSDASLSAEQKDALQSFWASQKQAMANALNQQIRRVRDCTATEYRHYQLKVSMALANGSNSNTALSVERQRIMQSELGQHRDAGGKRWKGIRYVETALRESLYGAFNTTMVFLLTVSGEHKGMIYRPGHGMDGAIFELDLFEDHQEDDFHPNARALVALSK